MTDIRLYQEEIMDHYRNPRYKGILEQATASGAMLNPSCGDAVSFQMQVIDGIITHIAFQGAGCVISQAAASMLSELLVGKSVTEIAQMNADTMLQLVKIPLGYTRLRCATLALQAAHKALAIVTSAE